MTTSRLAAVTPRNIRMLLAYKHPITADPRFVWPINEPIGPLGSGVMFYLDQLPLELFEHHMYDIEDEAFEAAREVIVTSIDEVSTMWLRHRPVIDAIARLTR